MTYFSERYGGTYVSLTEASERTGISRDFLLACIKRGDIRAVEIGSSLFLDSSSLNALEPRRGPEESKAEYIPRPAAGRKKNQKNSLERFVEGAEDAQVSSGPGRFVFEKEDALTAVPILFIALVALFLALPTKQNNSGLSEDALALFPSEVAESAGYAIEGALVRAGSVQTAAAEEPELSPPSSFGNVPNNESLLSNVLAGSAEALQAVARFVYDLFGVTE